jgi:HEAT repeat protein
MIDLTMLGIVLAVVLPILLGAAFLLGRYMRQRVHEGMELTAVTRQHLELYRGGQLNEADVEAAKARFRDWLEQGEVERVEGSLRPGIQYVVRVRALAEIGTEEAGQILERQLRRQLSDNPMDQAWYWIDLANSLRNLNREESLPHLFECVAEADDFPLVHYFAAETVCFLGFSGYALQIETPEGRMALRLLHRAIEGLRFGVPPQVVAEARLGELLENLWDQRPAEPDPLLARVFAEARRLLRRTAHTESALDEEPFEREAYELQVARLSALEPALEEYLDEARPYLIRRLPKARGHDLRDVICAMDELRIDSQDVLVKSLPMLPAAQREEAVFALRWSKHAAVGPSLRRWAEQVVDPVRRGAKRLRVYSPRRPTVPAEFPYRAILFSLRLHPSPESEQFLLTGAHDFDPAFRSTAVASLGWWEPFQRGEVLLHLQDARFDPSAEVRHAARTALARLGERQALEWFRQALHSDNRQRVLEAIQTIAVENLTLLWPELDRLADAEDPDLAYCAREALEQMREELDYRLRP